MRLQIILLIGAMLLGYCFGEQNSSPQKQYYDEREKVAERLTFEWAGVAYVKYTKEHYQAENERRMKWAEKAPGVLEILPLIDVEKASNLVFELNESLLIERTKNWTHAQYSTLGTIDMAELKVSNKVRSKELYFNQRNVIALNYEEDGEFIRGQIAECNEEDSALGMGHIDGTFGPEYLVFFGGVSPMRMYGGKLEEWKLVSCTPEEWVFERSVSLAKLADKVRIHLSRKYQDAISRMEIQKYNGWISEEWRVLEYQSIQGVWFPKEVEVLCKTGLGDDRVRWTLVGYRRSERLVFPKIGGDLRVSDWRQLGRRAWATDEGYELVEWDEVKSSLPELPEEKP